MPEEGTQAPEQEVQETPANEAEAASQEQPTIDWETDDNPYKKRYGDLRPEFDRTNQEAAQYREIYEALNSEDPELKKAGYEALGLQPPQEEDDDPDPNAQLIARLDKLEKAHSETAAQQQAREQQEQIADYVDGQLKDIEKSEGFEFSEPELKLLVAQAERLTDDQGRPDVKAAYNLLSEADKVRSERRVTRKKAPQVKTGQAGQKKWDRRNSGERIQRMAEVMSSEQ
jgi:hypothetical protein